MLKALLPVSYKAHFSSLIFLGLYGVLTVIPGLIHCFKNDGDAESVAGLKLGAPREVVIGVFVGLCATQIFWGLFILAVALHYNMLVPLLLLLIFLESRRRRRSWVRNGSVWNRPPEHYASLVLLSVGRLFLFLALTKNA